MYRRQIKICTLKTGKQSGRYRWTVKPITTATALKQSNCALQAGFHFAGTRICRLPGTLGIESTRNKRTLFNCSCISVIAEWILFTNKKTKPMTFLFFDTFLNVLQIHDSSRFPEKSGNTIHVINNHLYGNRFRHKQQNAIHDWVDVKLSHHEQTLLSQMWSQLVNLQPKYMFLTSYVKQLWISDNNKHVFTLVLDLIATRNASFVTTYKSPS